VHGVDENRRGFANEDEEATYCLSLLRDGDRTQKIVARERLSQIFERRGLLDEAAQCLETNVREGIRDPRIYQRLAGVYRRQGRHELADEVLLEARRLAERANRPPPGARPIRGGRPPGPRRPEPPPGPLEAPTSQLPAAQAPVATDTAPGELTLDVPPPPSHTDDVAGPVNRPWWTSPAVIVLGILLCGPFGALILAGMWVRGGYSMRARVTAIGVWVALMVLGSAATAVTIQSQMSSLISDPSRFGVVPAGPPAPGTPLLFPTPPIVAPASTQAPPAAKPAAAPSPPPVAASPGGQQQPAPSPIVISPPPPTLVTSPGEAPAAGEKVRVHDTGPSGANMRDKPGASGNVVKTAPDGSILQVIGPDQPSDGRTWRHVKDESGAEGWVAADFLEPAT
jgi:hypothetical protein